MDWVSLSCATVALLVSVAAGVVLWDLLRKSYYKLPWVFLFVIQVTFVLHGVILLHEAFGGTRNLKIELAVVMVKAIFLFVCVVQIRRVYLKRGFVHFLEWNSSFLENIPGPAAVIGLDGRLKMVNREFFLLGNLTPEAVREMQPTLAEVLNDEGVHGMVYTDGMEREGHIRDPKGVSNSCWMKFRSVKDESGSAIWWIVLFENKGDLGKELYDSLRRLDDVGDKLRSQLEANMGMVEQVLRRAVSVDKILMIGGDEDTQKALTAYWDEQGHQVRCVAKEWKGVPKSEFEVVVVVEDDQEWVAEAIRELSRDGGPRPLVVLTDDCHQNEEDPGIIRVKRPSGDAPGKYGCIKLVMGYCKGCVVRQRMQREFFP